MVKDPVCGMEIDPKSAFATREHMGQVFYFCSENCTKQFDANPHQYMHISSEPVGSATTGFNPNSTLLKVELPILGLGKARQSDEKVLRLALEKTAGIKRVILNSGNGKVVVDYDPKTIQILDIIGVIRKTGFQVGGAQKRIGIENIRCASCVGFIEEELKSHTRCTERLGQSGNTGSNG